MTEFETCVTQIIRRTYNVKSFRFSVPIDFSYKAGQFFFVTIRDGNEEKQKHFSFSSSPTEKGYVEFTKKLTGHEFSNALDNLKEGDWARLRGSFGDFVYESRYRKIAILTGGIGITAIRSICKVCTDIYPETDVILLYGNRTEADIVFKEDLDDMQKLNQNFRVVYTLSQPSPVWEGRVGHVDREMVQKEIADLSERTFYSCGPQGLVEAMEKVLLELNVARNQIIIENFPGY